MPRLRSGGGGGGGGNPHRSRQLKRVPPTPPSSTILQVCHQCGFVGIRQQEHQCGLYGAVATASVGEFGLFYNANDLDVAERSRLQLRKSMEAAALLLQCWWRKYLASRRVKHRRFIYNLAAVRLQSRFRGFSTLSHYRALQYRIARKKSLKSTMWRSMIEVKLKVKAADSFHGALQDVFEKRLKNAMATRIQDAVRSRQKALKFKRETDAVLLLQRTIVHGRRGRRKAEARKLAILRLQRFYTNWSANRLAKQIAIALEEKKMMQRVAAMQGNFSSLITFINTSSRSKRWVSRVRRRLAQGVRLQAWFRAVSCRRAYTRRLQLIKWVQCTVQAKWELDYRRRSKRAAIVLQRHCRRMNANYRVTKLLRSYDTLAHIMLSDKIPEAAGLYHADQLFTHEERHRKIGKLGALRAYQDMIHESRLLFIKFSTWENPPKRAFLLKSKSLKIALRALKIDLKLSSVKEALEKASKAVYGREGLSMPGWVELLGALANELYADEKDLATKLRVLLKDHIRPLVRSLAAAFTEKEWVRPRNWFSPEDKLRPPMSEDARVLYVFFDTVPAWLDVKANYGHMEARPLLCKGCMPLSREVEERALNVVKRNRENMKKLFKSYHTTCDARGKEVMSAEQVVSVLKSCRAVSTDKEKSVVLQIILACNNSTLGLYLKGVKFVKNLSEIVQCSFKVFLSCIIQLVWHQSGHKQQGNRFPPSLQMMFTDLTTYCPNNSIKFKLILSEEY